MEECNRADGHGVEGCGFCISTITVFPNSGLGSPSDETAPPSSSTPSVQFDSNGTFTRYKPVCLKVCQVRIPNECSIVCRDPEYTTGGIDTWNEKFAFVTWYLHRSDSNSCSKFLTRY